MSTKTGKRRHYCTVMLDPESLDDHGQPRGADSAYIKDVPCSIETLSGREAEIARQQYAQADYLVTCSGDPARPIREHMFLQLDTRRLEIGVVKDIDQNGVNLELLCGEVLSG